MYIVSLAQIDFLSHYTYYTILSVLSTQLKFLGIRSVHMYNYIFAQKIFNLSAATKVLKNESKIHQEPNI